MLRLGIGAGLSVTLAVLAYYGVQWLREDAVKDFMREAAVVAAEKAQADAATKDQIVKEIDNATIDELRERAASGGMFLDTDP